MSDWRPSLLAATIVIFGGGFVGAVTADRSTTTAKTASRSVPSTTVGPRTVESGIAGQSTSTAAPSGIEITPPAESDAPDTITELYRAGQVDDDFGGTDNGTQTIAGKTYEDGVSMYTDRNGDNFSINTGELPIKTKNRYRRLRGVVGINGDTPCPRNDASVSITDDQGQTLWGPERVSFSVAKRFDISIKDLPAVNLVQRSLAPSTDNCENDDLTYPAWGEVEFVK